MKLNLNRAIEQFETESIENQEIKQHISKICKDDKHPYLGLSDNFGYLTRFPKEICKIPREWMLAFLQNGGKLDSCQHYGISPLEDWLKDISAEMIAEITNRKTWGFCSSSYHNLFSVCGDIKTTDEKHLQVINLYSHRYEEIIQHCTLKDVRVNPWRIGRMTKKQFANWLSNNVVKINYPERSEYAKGLVDNIYDAMTYSYRSEDYEDCESYGGYVIVTEKYHTRNSAIRHCLLSRKKRQEKLSYGRNFEPTPYLNHQNNMIAKRLFDVKFLEWYNSSMAKIKNIDTLRSINWVIDANLIQNYAYTSLGKVLYNENSRLLVHKNKKDYIEYTQIKQVNEYSFAMLKGQYFVWLTEEGFFRHTEAETLKEGISKLAGRKKIKGLVMSLSNIRQNTCFCFAGVKNFLKNKMKHVFNLVKDASGWDDVPQEILNVEWELASRDIFQGYPEP